MVLCSWLSHWVIRQVPYAYLDVITAEYPCRDRLQQRNNFSSFITQTEQLVDLLLNSITLSVPLTGSLNPHFLSFSHGEYFYSLFQNTTNAELLLQLDRSVPLLLNAATQSPNMVRFPGRIIRESSVFALP